MESSVLFRKSVNIIYAKINYMYKLSIICIYYWSQCTQI